MDNRAIGIFDSGLGGLTAMKALQELLPEENIIYFGDTGRLPYGAKTREQLRRMAAQDLDLIASGGVSSLEDIRALRGQGLYGAILGKAYYTGAVDLREALEAAR